LFRQPREPQRSLVSRSLAWMRSYPSWSEANETTPNGQPARGTAPAGSDGDLLVAFERPVGLFAFVGLQHGLTDLLGRPVDLVPRDGLKPRLRAAARSRLEDVLEALVGGAAGHGGRDIAGKIVHELQDGAEHRPNGRRENLVGWVGVGVSVGPARRPTGADRGRSQGLVRGVEAVRSGAHALHRANDGFLRRADGLRSSALAVVPCPLGVIPSSRRHGH